MALDYLRAYYGEQSVLVYDKQLSNLHEVWNIGEVIPHEQVRVMLDMRSALWDLYYSSVGSKLKSFD